MVANKLYIFLTIIAITLIGCSSTKYVAKDQYLLDKVRIKSDSKELNTSDLNYFLRQTPNSSFPLLGKTRLRANNIKIVRKILPRFVEKPVIFSSRQTATSAEQLRLEVSNRGFLHAEVDTIITRKHKKAEVTFLIRPKEGYHIRTFTNEVNDSTIYHIIEMVKKNSLIKEGNMFNLETLDNEKTRIAQTLGNMGYYNFNKNDLYYKADTTVGNHSVDLSLCLYPRADSLPYPRYKLRNITLIPHNDTYDAQLNNTQRQTHDTLQYKGINIIYEKKRFLKPSVLYKNNFLRPDTWYGSWRTNATISSFGSIGAIRQTNIRLTDTLVNDTARLDATILLPQANTHWLQTSLEGTNSAGDIGAAGSIAYRHQNLFNGAEVLGIKLRGAYEFVSGSTSYDLSSQNFYEYGVETSLTFPQILFPFLPDHMKEQPMAATQFSTGLTKQKRPEYDREFFNLTINYKWSNFLAGLSHSLDILDINYVRMPWVSQSFRQSYLENSKYPLLKYSYEDQLIARTAYTLSFTGKRQLFSPSTYTLRASIDLGGLLPRLIQTLGGTSKDNNNNHQLLGIRYAEYAKIDLNISKIHRLNSKSSIAYHAGIGVAKPYGNSEILPFEKRYFSGGSNSVRGWSTRRLGPGFYHPNKDSIEFANQVGDIKLDLNIEWRHKLTELLQLALFADAGNIWVIDNNSNTPENGLFKFSQFYRQIALAYGLGLRIDMGFLLIRFDGGFKCYDPGRYSNERWRFKTFNFKDDFAFHFAIGYPF